MSTHRSSTPEERAANRVNARRTSGLSVHAAALLREAAQSLERGNLAAAELALLTANIKAPENAEVLRWRGMLRMKQGRNEDAITDFERALVARPDDAVVLCLLATAQSAVGNDSAALISLLKAAECAEEIPEWLNLGIEFDRQGYAYEALSAADRAIALGARDGATCLLRARCLQALGQTEAATAAYRNMIARGLRVPSAWFGLLDQKTVRIEATELVALEQAERAAAAVAGDDRTMLAFALGNAYEGAEQYANALATLARANAHARVERPWDAVTFSAQVDAARAAFGQIEQRADVEQGNEVIFIVGLPRSGTTLIEQVLASHPQVEGASELPYLYRVIGEESSRHGKPFPHWVLEASSEDWTRMGRRYLALSARWRTRRPRATDKLPANWLLAGAVRSMLPAARIVGCRRDPIETCWSCYKQLFARGMADFAYDFHSLAAYWHDYDRLSRFWTDRHPTHFHIQHHEELVANTKTEVRALLDFCGLPFDADCLRFHEAQRSIRSASAAQVRRPLRQDTARTTRYGPLLAPLRALLESSNSDRTPH